MEHSMVLPLEVIQVDLVEAPEEEVESGEPGESVNITPGTIMV